MKFKLLKVSDEGMEISQRIKSERQAAEWTQEQLADRIFVSKRTISNWETGKTIPDIESVLRLSTIFKLSLDDLLVEDSDVVKEIKRKEKIAKLSVLYFVGPILTALLLLVVIFLPEDIPHRELTHYIVMAAAANFITMFAFQFKIDRLKGKEVDLDQQLKQGIVAGAGLIISFCIFLIVLHFL